MTSLVHQIEAFLNRSEMPATRFGRLVGSDPRLVLDIRMGRRPRKPLENRIVRFIRNWGDKRYEPNILSQSQRKTRNSAPRDADKLTINCIKKHR
tara:strand:- start:1653 stop:1937 length:285 start_codon:yes stop_codon:yes gene_type:complete